MPPPPARGPLAAAAVRLDAPPAGGAPRLVYADLDLAERPALRRALGLGPAPLGDGSHDETLVLAAHRRWGAEAPAHLGGAFAYALWEPAARRLTATRDPIGLRPLVWARVGVEVVVGGDVRALLATGRVPDVLDDDVMAAVLVDGRFAPSLVGRTCIRGVAEVRGGTSLVATPEGAREARYWHPEATPRTGPRTRGEIGEALRAVLREVAAEAVAGEPAGGVGVHLSSGIDSTAVAAFAAEALADAGRPAPSAYAWQPPPSASRAAEHARIEAAAARWGLPLRYCPVSVEVAVAGRSLDATRDPVTMWNAEEPVRRAARADGVGLLLSGWGGDEAASFSGRDLADWHLLRTGRPGPVLAGALRAPVDTLRQVRRGWARLADDRARPTVADRFAAVVRGDAGAFAAPALLQRAAPLEPEAPPPTPHARMAWVLRRGHLGDRTGDWARAGAARGLRYRYPLLDRRVVRLALSLPDEAWRTQGGLRRWPLRAAAEGLVPDAVRLGPKAEPALQESYRFEGHRPVFSQLLPRLTPETIARRADWIDGVALREALEALCAGTWPPGRPEGGLHALWYLDLGAP